MFLFVSCFLFSFSFLKRKLKKLSDRKMSVTGSKRRKIYCETIDVGADGLVRNDLTVNNDLTVGDTVTAKTYAGGSFTPTFKLPNGSASPALAFNTSTNSGLYWDTTATAGPSMSVGGTRTMKWDTSGNTDVFGN